MIRRAKARGLTLVEVMVAIAVLAMISVLLYGTFDSLSHGKKAESIRGDRARQGRMAVQRMVRELTSAFLSGHNPTNPTLQTRTVVFVGQNFHPNDRIDFQAFAHRRMEANSHESDQAEIGYFAAEDPNVDGKIDLVRREQSPADTDAKKGGVINVLCEDIEAFDLRYLDAQTGQWLEIWDTTQASGQLNRIPVEMRVTLTLKHTPPGVEPVYTTKFMLPIVQPLTFGIPQ